MVKLHRQTPHKPTGAIRVSALPAPLAKGLKNQAQLSNSMATVGAAYQTLRL